VHKGDKEGRPGRLVIKKEVGEMSRLQLDLYEKGKADLRDPQQISKADLEKLIRE